MVMNAAFVFIKPHANTPETQKLVAETFVASGITILKEGELTGEQIDEGKLIDQHYYAIASKATLLQPEALPVPADKFEAWAKISWAEALASKKVYNAVGACEYFGWPKDGVKLEAAWRLIKPKLIKFGGGFYCGLMEAEGKEPIYVFNAFFMSMRAAFVKPGTSIHFYSVEFDSATLSWADFRGQVLGPTDPSQAPSTSVRGIVFSKWEELKLKAEPDIGNNGVHASASPFEGLAERLNWLKASVKDDPFGASLLEAGVDVETIEAWSIDPQVPGIGSLFDHMEDCNADDVIAKAVAIVKA